MINNFAQLLKKLKAEILAFKTNFRRTNSAVVADERTFNLNFTIARVGTFFIQSTQRAIIRIKGAPKDSLCQIQIGQTTLDQRFLMQTRTINNASDVVSQFVVWIEYGNQHDAEEVEAGRTVRVNYPMKVVSTAKIESVEVSYINQPYS